MDVTEKMTASVMLDVVKKKIERDLYKQTEWRKLIVNLYAKACVMESDDYHVKLTNLLGKMVGDGTKGHYSQTIAYKGKTDFANKRDGKHGVDPVLGHQITVVPLSKYVFRLNVNSSEQLMSTFRRLLSNQYNRKTMYVNNVLMLIPKGVKI